MSSPDAVYTMYKCKYFDDFYRGWHGW
ncbi:hypothetical protein MY5147_009981, partial [Beauveria neobassiana]